MNIAFNEIIQMKDRVPVDGGPEWLTFNSFCAYQTAPFKEGSRKNVCGDYFLCLCCQDNLGEPKHSMLQCLQKRKAINTQSYLVCHASLCLVETPRFITLTICSQFKMISILSSFSCLCGGKMQRAWPIAAIHAHLQFLICLDYVCPGS